MNTDEIVSVLKNSSVTRSYFIDVVACDRLFEALEKHLTDQGQHFIIVNIAPEVHSGIHWVLLFKPKGRHKTIFFDSFNKKPESYNKFIIEGVKFTSTYTNYYNRYECINFTLQSNKTRVCGIYCIFIAYYLCRGFSLNDIISHNFSVIDKCKNDRLICSWYNTYCFPTASLTKRLNCQTCISHSSSANLL